MNCFHRKQFEIDYFHRKKFYAMVDMPVLPWVIYINYIKGIQEYMCVSDVLSLCIKLLTRVCALCSIGCWCLFPVLPGHTSKTASSSGFVLRKGQE